MSGFESDYSFLWGWIWTTSVGIHSTYIKKGPRGERCHKIERVQIAGILLVDFERWMMGRSSNVHALTFNYERVWVAVHKWKVIKTTFIEKPTLGGFGFTILECNYSSWLVGVVLHCTHSFGAESKTTWVWIKPDRKYSYLACNRHMTRKRQHTEMHWAC